jgi:hypothetical protein
MNTEGGGDVLVLQSQDPRELGHHHSVRPLLRAGIAGDQVATQKDGPLIIEVYHLETRCPNP